MRGPLIAGRLNLQDPQHMEFPVQAVEEHKTQVAADEGAMHEASALKKQEQKEHAEHQQHARATVQEQGGRILQQRMGLQAPDEGTNANTAAATAEADAKLQRELEQRSKAAAAYSEHSEWQSTKLGRSQGRKLEMTPT